MQIKFENRVYDVLKWMCLVVLPAIAVIYNTLSSVWHWPYANEVSKTITAVCVFIGSLIGVSTVAYNKSHEEDHD